jgi:hypothetical protein
MAKILDSKTIGICILIQIRFWKIKGKIIKIRLLGSGSEWSKDKA